ncbi:glycosyltransferase [Ideonella sp.]|uniref:glycosyltransferase n=1 Tax=Ideonella sp. TaxID=1929293 RepID=UPI003BB64654
MTCSAIVGAVVIGRNEGDRLARCLTSLGPLLARCVYVDSDSSDDSVRLAGASGAAVLALDMRTPFSAARARNEGFALLQARWPDTEWVQFIDGDCELQSGWPGLALAHGQSQADLAAVCGRRRERHPEASVFNQICDIEWNTPVGEARAFGGDVLLRVAALQSVKGYEAAMIAGEEPELALRLRAAGWRIWRLDAEMTLHDAAMTRWRQWWQRNLRAGHAYAEGAWRHGAAPERHKLAETRRAIAWGGVLPVTLLALLPVLPIVSLAGVLAYPLQAVRLGLRFQADQRNPVPWRYAALLVLARFPEAAGALSFYWRLWMRKPARIIEYK